ncbi:putative DNA-binding transcriptional regulator AlpA [Friedmanniella endophytica]|uniref:Putative DNA-binding transcriptional regulator AlpA n=1 Tax=Microlunatus kandeliicorticis TaxID=1759536 RepID=A0A7W3IPG9_9ACTN|nr:helix-turn-helix domain-containing protein [Microlunatus kandeliicorticis]MBA8792835.1 putative DNA-binding transcriptional regulator AlpA [Microlunatus kandeliicorticis]
MTTTARPTPINGTAGVRGSEYRLDKLTLAQLCDELQIARSTFYDWRSKGHAPRCIKLPNGDLRIRRSDLDAWLAEHEEGFGG